MELNRANRNLAKNLSQKQLPESKGTFPMANRKHSRNNSNRISAYKNRRRRIPLRRNPKRNASVIPRQPHKLNRSSRRSLEPKPRNGNKNHMQLVSFQPRFNESKQDSRYNAKD